MSNFALRKTIEDLRYRARRCNALADDLERQGLQQVRQDEIDHLSAKLKKFNDQGGGIETSGEKIYEPKKRY